MHFQRFDNLIVRYTKKLPWIFLVLGINETFLAGYSSRIKAVRLTTEIRHVQFSKRVKTRETYATTKLIDIVWRDPLKVNKHDLLQLRVQICNSEMQLISCFDLTVS